MRALLSKLFWASRPISWINTAYPFAAGYLILMHSVDWQWIIGSLYFLIPYNLMMYGVNDVFDYESDLRNPRKGGIEGGLAAKKFHGGILWSVVITNVPFLVFLIIGHSLISAVTLLVVVFMVLAYSLPVLRFKERPFLDSITSSSHFVGPLVYALSLAGFPRGAWPLVAAFFLWGMASHAFGSVQDIKADREGDIGSVATVIGARWTVCFTAALYLASATLLIATTRSAWAIAICVLLYVANVGPYLTVTDDDAPRAHAGWRRFLWLNWITGAVVTITLLLGRR